MVPESVCLLMRMLTKEMCRKRFRGFLVLMMCLVTLGLLTQTFSQNGIEIWQHHTSHVTRGLPQTHVFFLRIPKTGTSTTTCMFWRFAIRHGITVLLPKPHKEGTFEEISADNHELGNPEDRDIVANQLIYNPQNFQQLLSPNTSYVALLRHPLMHMASVIYYKGHDFLQVIPGTDPIAEYLHDPAGYESKLSHRVSLTNNPYALYFGLDKRNFQNQSSVKELISKIDKEFAAVLILEYFEESLIMMRRILRWSFEDIIYRERNANTAKPNASRPILSEIYVKLRHREWDSADYDIYYHFVRKLQTYAREGGDDFAQEVFEFRSVLEKIHNFCYGRTRTVDSSVFIAGGAFHDSFIYTAENCTLLSTSARELRKAIRHRQGLPPE